MWSWMNRVTLTNQVNLWHIGVQTVEGIQKSSSTQQVRWLAYLKKYKPVTPGQRGRVTVKNEDLWKGKPFRALTKGLRKTGGRNNQGRITAFHRGGGHKRRYRFVDFERGLQGVEGKVKRIEYDPNRSANIALIEYEKDLKTDYALVKKGHSYIIAPENLKEGDVIQAGKNSPVKPGNAMQLMHMPVGTTIHNIELKPGRGGQMARSAGTFATLVRRQGPDGYCLVRLPSGEQRLVLGTCKATVGVVGNKDHHNQRMGKAGANRWKGRRPVVRGVAMNPVDHPHGGGEGKASGGRPSVTPWGKPTKGKRTRNNPLTDKFIQLSRRDAKRKDKR